MEFKEIFKDIVDVDNVDIFWFGSDHQPLTMETLAFAAGERKDSALCGFKFKSKINPTYDDLEIVFCSKLRSKIYRRAPQNPSQWFAFLKMPSKNQIQVLSKSDLLLATDFDVDAFFNTSYFKNTCPIFLDGIEDTLNKVDDITDPGPQHIKPSEVNKKYYVKSICESIDLIPHHRFNDKTFTLYL